MLYEVITTKVLRQLRARAYYEKQSVADRKKAIKTAYKIKMRTEQGA